MVEAWEKTIHVKSKLWTPCLSCKKSRLRDAQIQKVCENFKLHNHDILEVQIVEIKYLDENEDSNIDKDINTSIDEDKDDSDVAYNKPFIIAFQK